MKLLGSSTQTNGLNISVTGNSFLGSITHANTATRTYTLPNNTGTVALLTDIHAPVTLGTANGLSLATQTLSLGLASSGVTGALSGTDWNTFNGKQAAYTLLTTFGSLANAAGYLYNDGSGVLSYATSSSGGVSSFNTRTGVVTLTSSDVTTALTYTPINKAGDSGIGNLNMGALIATSAVLSSTNSVGLAINNTNGGSSNCEMQFNLAGTSYYDLGTNITIGSGAALEFYDRGYSRLMLSLGRNNSGASFNGGPVSMGALMATSGTFAPASNSYSQLVLLGSSNGSGSQSASFLFSDAGNNSLDISTNYVSGSNLIRFKPGGALALTLAGSGAATFASSVSMGALTATGNATIGDALLTNPQGWARVLQVNSTGTGGCGISVKDAFTNGEWNLASYGGNFRLSNGASSPALLITPSGAATFSSSVSMGALSATTGTFSSTVSATSFSGDGTGLTGTASSLSIGGNAATSTYAHGLHRNDDSSNYNVQPNWTGSYWYLRGYSIDTYHAGCMVDYASSAGNLTGHAAGYAYADGGTSSACSGNAYTSGYSSAVNYSPNRTDSTAYPILWGSSGTYSGQTGTIAYSCAAVTINSSTGTILATNVGATSDERLKTNITPILNPIDKVKNLNGFYFNWNELASSLDKTTTHVGVSAQHTLKTFPEAVVEGEEYLSVTYNSFIPLLIECVKEQQKEIEELKRLIHDFTK